MHIYVDRLFTAISRDPEARRVGKRNAHKWCHLWTDVGNEEELHALAAQIGLKREWFQPKSGFPHYDCTPGRRRKAIVAGAIEMDLREWLRKQREPLTATIISHHDAFETGMLHLDPPEGRIRRRHKFPVDTKVRLEPAHMMGTLRVYRAYNAAGQMDYFTATEVKLD